MTDTLVKATTKAGAGVTPAEEGAALLITYTLFENVQPTTKTERADVPWSDLVQRLRQAPTYIDKGSCPLISMCEYGELLSEGGILRHGANVRRVYGAELDYDGELISIEQAADALNAAGLRAVLYTSPSYTRAKPRWRAIFPFSEPAIPAKRGEYLARANRVLCGAASRESFALSQSFYLGRVRGAEYLVLESTGRCADLAAELTPLYHLPNTRDDESALDETTDEQLRAAFERGEDRYGAMLKLSARWAARGMGDDDIEANLRAMLGDDSRNADGVDLKSRCRPMARSAVRKFGETRAKQNQTPEGNPPKLTPFPTALAMPVGQFNKLKLPPREPIIEGLLLSQALCEIFSTRGLGKTMLALDMAVQIARGHGKFLEWTVPGNARRVLYVDGEMAAADLQERSQKFCGTQVPEGLQIMASELVYATLGEALNFANLEHQLRFIGMLDMLEAEGRKPEAIFLDNKSALTSGIDENSNTEQDVILNFLRTLRHRGHTVILVHHAGKSGEQRGASRIEDPLDLVIKLDKPKGDEEEEGVPSSGRGAAFRMSFTKHRGLRPDPAMLDLELMEDMDGSFTWGMTKPARGQKWVRVGAFIRDHGPSTQVEIIQGLGMDAGDVSRAVKTLREREMLEPGKGLDLTKNGRAYLDKARPVGRSKSGDF